MRLFKSLLGCNSFVLLANKFLLKAFSVLSSVLDGRNIKEASPFPPGLYNLVVKSKK